MQIKCKYIKCKYIYMQIKCKYIKCKYTKCKYINIYKYICKYIYMQIKCKYIKCKYINIYANIYICANKMQIYKMQIYKYIHKYIYANIYKQIKCKYIKFDVSFLQITRKRKNDKTKFHQHSAEAPRQHRNTQLPHHRCSTK